MLEWATIAAAVTPFVKEHVSALLKKAGNKGAELVVKRAQHEQKLLEVNRKFCERFSKELDSVIELETLTAPAFKEGLQRFMRSEAVQDLITAPLDAESTLDPDALAALWREIKTESGDPLPALPDDFSWSSLAKTYCTALNRQILEDPDLRQLRMALTTERAAETLDDVRSHLERIAGPLAGFDLNRYANALKRSYQHVRLGAIHPDWSDTKAEFGFPRFTSPKV